MATTSLLAMNSALVFIKPQANTVATQDLVRATLVAAGCSVVEEGSIDGVTIDQKRLIDQHYYAIASKATLLSPESLAVPADKFLSAFGETWAKVLAEDRATNAMQACERWNCSPAELEATFRAAEKVEGNVVKFGGGFYCGKIPPPPGRSGDTLYVFNAFFMAMRAKFVGPSHSIFYFSVEWDPQAMSWAHFRAQLLGPTDPAVAPEGSLRAKILAQWESLGLEQQPSKGDNGVHASASPFEGLAEKVNWLQKGIPQESFGAALLAAGVPLEKIEAWAIDPRVRLPAGDEGSLFDALEDLDAPECLAKCIELAKL